MLAIYNQFDSSISDARTIITMAHATDPSGAFLWHTAARTQIVEGAFLKAFTSWESLLEASFVDFLMGSPSAIGTLPTRYASPLTKDHANKMIMGNLRYFPWAQPDAVKKVAKNFFPNGDPYETVLSSLQSDLIDMKTIRNATAHVSSTTAPALDALSSRKLKTVVVGFTPSQLLLAVDPSSTTGDTIVNYYFGQLQTAAHMITHM